MNISIDQCKQSQMLLLWINTTSNLHFKDQKLISTIKILKRIWNKLRFILPYFNLIKKQIVNIYLPSLANVLPCDVAMSHVSVCGHSGGAGMRKLYKHQVRDRGPFLCRIPVDSYVTQHCSHSFQLQSDFIISFQ